MKFTCVLFFEVAVDLAGDQFAEGMNDLIVDAVVGGCSSLFAGQELGIEEKLSML